LVEGERPSEKGKKREEGHSRKNKNFKDGREKLSGNMKGERLHYPGRPYILLKITRPEVDKKNGLGAYRRDGGSHIKK